MQVDESSKACLVEGPNVERMVDRNLSDFPRLTVSNKFELLDDEGEQEQHLKDNDTEDLFVTDEVKPLRRLKTKKPVADPRGGLMGLQTPPRIGGQFIYFSIHLSVRYAIIIYAIIPMRYAILSRPLCHGTTAHKTTAFQGGLTLQFRRQIYSRTFYHFCTPWVELHSDAALER